MDLPYEVLVYLFEYLPKSDRLAAGETCKNWYLAANDRIFLKNKVAVFYKISLNDEVTSPLQIFLNSPINYSNFIFQEVEITSKSNDFWERLGCNISSLTLNNCDIGEKEFVDILKCSPNLETVNIINCRELFMSGRLLEGKTDGLLVDNLEQLKVLNLSGNQYLTDALFNRFARATPVLEILNLNGCSLQFHLGLVKKFYPPYIDITENPSESVLTFYFILHCIRSKAKSIKSLLFSKTLIDGAALKTLAEVENLKLETLEVSCCDQLTNDGILSLTLHQSLLKELDIGMCSRVTDQSLINICNNLVNLEYLNIQRCRAVTDLGIQEIKKLTKLKSLNISQCEQVTKNGIQIGICSTINPVIEKLDIHSLNLDQSGIIMISENLPNLRYLNISCCFNAVTDKSIQVIFKNQVLLHTLKMNYCDKVTDAGLTGLGTQAPDEGEGSVDFNDHGPVPRIHLGSRAEEEIVRDARRKRDVLKLCEVSLDEFTGYSLSHLKNLRELDLSDCNRITDVSLTYTFRFKDLYILNMSRCQQITQDGIEYLVKNCPSIEYLNLTDCYNLNDEAVGKIVKGLSRLKQLELRGCNQLTDKTLEHVQKYCQKLRYLDVQGCRNINPETACSITNIPTLHTVLMSKPGPYITDGVKQRSNGGSFLPVLMKKLLSRRSADRDN